MGSHPVKTNCRIWQTHASLYQSGDPATPMIHAARAGGSYAIEHLASALLDRDQTTYDERFRARLTSWLIEQRALGTEYPKVTSAILQQVEDRKPLPVHERADRLLEEMSKKTEFVGEVVRIQKTLGVQEELFAHSESTSSNELMFLLTYLAGKAWLNRNDANQYTVTVEGFTRIAELQTKAIPSNHAFVAMWFDDSMAQAYENGIKPAIEEAGYISIRIDKKPHNNKIDDEIIAEIRRSRFVVADFTEGKKGTRGGVYYEAGFAHGLNIPVVFTCRKDSLEKVHFDTRQYNHIVWEDSNALRQSLAQRISAVIGDGPGRDD